MAISITKVSKLGGPVEVEMFAGQANSGAYVFQVLNSDFSGRIEDEPGSFRTSILISTRYCCHHYAEVIRSNLHSVGAVWHGVK